MKNNIYINQIKYIKTDIDDSYISFESIKIVKMQHKFYSAKQNIDIPQDCVKYCKSFGNNNAILALPLSQISHSKININ